MYLSFDFILQDGTVVTSVVRRLLLNFITRPRIPFTSTAYPVYSVGNQPGVLQRVGSAAGMYPFILQILFCSNYIIIFLFFLLGQSPV